MRGHKRILRRLLERAFHVTSLAGETDLVCARCHDSEPFEAEGYDVAEAPASACEPVCSVCRAALASEPAKWTEVDRNIRRMLAHYRPWLSPDLGAPDARCLAGDHAWRSVAVNAEHGREDFFCGRCGESWTARF